MDTNVHRCTRVFLAQTAVTLQVDRLVSGDNVTTLARIVGSVAEELHIVSQPTSST